MDYWINLDIDQPVRANTRIALNQANVNSTKFIFKIWRDAQPFNLAQFDNAEVTIQLPDKSVVVGKTLLTNTEIDYTVNQEVFNVPGVLVGYVTLLKEGAVTATLYFDFRVIDDFIDTETIEAVYVQRLEDLIQQLAANADLGSLMRIGGSLTSGSITDLLNVQSGTYRLTADVSGTPGAGDWNVLWMRPAAANGLLIAFKYDAPTKLYYNTWSGGAWLGWSSPVNSSGDTMTGTLSMNMATSIFLSDIFQNKYYMDIANDSLNLLIRKFRTDGIVNKGQTQLLLQAPADDAGKSSPDMFRLLLYDSSNVKTGDYRIWAGHNFDPGSKVNKAGDTMTGRLDVDNKNIYDTQIRMFSDTGYTALFDGNSKLLIRKYTHAPDVDQIRVQLALNSSPDGTVNADTLHLTGINSGGGFSGDYKIWGEHNFPLQNGSWTPAFVGTTTAGSGGTYSVTGASHWWRNGNICYIVGKFGYSVLPTGMSGNLRITGLPFVPDANLTDAPVGYFSSVNTVVIAGVSTSDFALRIAGGSAPALDIINRSGTGVYSNADQSLASTNGLWIFQATYTYLI